MILVQKFNQQFHTTPSHHQILVTSTLALSKTLCPSTSASLSSSEAIFLGVKLIATYVPGPRRLESVPGFTQRTDSTTWELC